MIASPEPKPTLAARFAGLSGLRGSGSLAAALLAAIILSAAVEAAESPAPAAAPPSVPNATSPETDAAEKLSVDGFRSARWGMNEAEVKASIRKDFNVPPEKVLSEQNPSERTTVLSATVPDLLEGAGPARLSYIFGYTTKKLIQVNVAWGTAADPQAKVDRVTPAANQLQQLLLSSGYEPDSIISNVRSNDGSVMLFRGEDSQKRTTMLRLLNGVSPAKPGEKPAPAVALWLSYILDARNPDIFRLKKGQF